MQYREFPPSPALEPHIHCYWLLEDPAPLPCPAQPVYPDGSPEIVYHFGAPFSRTTASGSAVQPRGLLIGQMLEAAHLAPTGPAGVFGIRFKPAGLAAFVNVPMDEFANRITPLDAVARPLDALLSDVVPGTLPWARKVAMIEERLRTILRPPGPAIAAAAQYIITSLAGQPALSIDALSVTFGLSARQFRRRFAAETGIGPKTFARIARFQRALRSLGRAPLAGVARAPLAGVAIDAGYYDQPHMIADFREFAGVTPRAALKPDRLTEVFLR